MPIVAAIPFFIATAVVTIAVSTGLNMLMGALFPRSQQRQEQQQQPNSPPPPNGTVNETQPIPPLRVIAGRVRTTGDEAFLEEKGGHLYQSIVHASHRIEGYVQHWLHDEIVTVDPATSWITAPAHFGQTITLAPQLGENAGTAFGDLVSNFPSIWSVAHRGDGLAKILLTFRGVSAEDFGKVYSKGRPEHSCLLDGARLYDPRDGSTAFSRNLALIRLFHLTHPSGCRLTVDDLYLPDWITASDVCDELVIDRDEEEQPRYWGGIQWKYRGDGQDAVSVGRRIDEAAELVVYERGDGLIGVHAGRMETPTIRLTDAEIVSFRYDANQSLGSTVLAVRGRFTDPRNDWMPGDAAIYGDPYGGGDNSQRTATVDNDVVQSHNHANRLQKLRFIRANAPRISVVVHYSEATADLLTSRFVTVHKPERGCDEATVELVGGTRLSLRDLTIAFEAIVVPATLYDFDAATEESIPGGIVGSIEATGVPVPTGFDVAWLNDSAGYYGRATWTHVNDTFTYELQYQLEDASEPPRSVSSNPTETVLRTPPVPNAMHRFRLRTWSLGAPSAWTAWLAPGTSAGDTTPTADPSGLAANFSGLNDSFGYGWTNPSDGNFHHTEVYRADSAIAPFSEAVLVYTDYGAPGSAGSYGEMPSFASTVASEVSVWVRSYNVSGVPSALVGPATASRPP